MAANGTGLSMLEPSPAYGLSEEVLITKPVTVDSVFLDLVSDDSLS